MQNGFFMFLKIVDLSQDGESGWSSLHRALHFGHLAVACVLLLSGATSTLEDSKFRTPVDLLSGPVLQAIGRENNSSMVPFFETKCSWSVMASFGMIFCLSSFLIQ